MLCMHNLMLIVNNSILFRVKNTGCSIDESLVNHLGDSNHGSGDRNLSSLQKRRSSPNFFLKPREDDTNFAGRHCLINFMNRFERIEYNSLLHSVESFILKFIQLTLFSQTN